MNMLEALIDKIHPVVRAIEPAVIARLDSLTKPPGSLGKLEKIALRYCLTTGTATPVFGKKRIYTFAADHGVADEGVSAYPKTVTPQMVRNMLGGGAAVNALARHANAEVRVVDMGVDDPLDDAPGLVRRKIKHGTANIAHGPAMTMEEAMQAIMAGADLAAEAVSDGVTLIGTGEMGIANTTPSAALMAVLLPCEVEAITGRGTGIDDAGLERKITAIRRAIDSNGKRCKDGPLAALAMLGGFEIAGICGLVLGAASCGTPVVVDGFISSAGALTACRICPLAADYIFWSHQSEERGHATFFKQFGADPILDLGMRLGEGTGAALAMMIIEAAVKVYNEMATFESAGVSGKTPNRHAGVVVSGIHNSGSGFQLSLE
jgi:nicotinate-nucleotide--dimethylbenzimidazole phosphoribosyltransferase